MKNEEATYKGIYDNNLKAYAQRAVEKISERFKKYLDSAPLAFKSPNTFLWRSDFGKCVYV